MILIYNVIHSIYSQFLYWLYQSFIFLHTKIYDIYSQVFYSLSSIQFIFIILSSLQYFIFLYILYCTLAYLYFIYTLHTILFHTTLYLGHLLSWIDQVYLYSCWYVLLMFANRIPYIKHKLLYHNITLSHFSIPTTNWCMHVHVLRPNVHIPLYK